MITLVKANTPTLDSLRSFIIPECKFHFYSLEEIEYYIDISNDIIRECYNYNYLTNNYTNKIYELKRTFDYIINNIINKIVIHNSDHFNALGLSLIIKDTHINKKLTKNNILLLLLESTLYNNRIQLSRIQNIVQYTLKYYPKQKDRFYIKFHNLDIKEISLKFIETLGLNAIHELRKLNCQELSINEPIRIDIYTSLYEIINSGLILKYSNILIDYFNIDNYDYNK